MILIITLINTIIDLIFYIISMSILIIFSGYNYRKYSKNISKDRIYYICECTNHISYSNTFNYYTYYTLFHLRLNHLTDEN